MKTPFRLTVLTSLLMFISGCSKEVQVEAIPNLDPNILMHANAQIPPGRPDVFSGPYRNPYGSIEFVRMNADTIQVLRTCTAGDSFCNTMNAEASATFSLQLGDSTSVYTHVLQGNNWITRASENADVLTLTSIVRSPDGTHVQAVEETFQMMDDPCEYGAGQGLENHLRVTENDGNGEEWTSDSCQAFY